MINKKIFVKTKEELKDAIQNEINKNGLCCDLNHLDISQIKDLSFIFKDSEFEGDISQWNLSNVKNMSGMFYNSKFNRDISDWDTSNVKSMNGLFYLSKFNGDISEWDVSSLKEMSYMFMNSEFNGDVSKWDVSNVENINSCFGIYSVKPWWYIENNKERQVEIKKRKLEEKISTPVKNKSLKI